MLKKALLIRLQRLQQKYMVQMCDFSFAAKTQIKNMKKLGLDKVPVCIAKTTFSI